MAKLPGGPLGLEAHWAWRPFGPGGPLGLEAHWAWGPFWPKCLSGLGALGAKGALWAWGPFGPGGPLGLEALGACHYHHASQLLSFRADQKVFSYFLIFLKIHTGQTKSTIQFFLGQNV